MAREDRDLGSLFFPPTRLRWRTASTINQKATAESNFWHETAPLNKCTSLIFENAFTCIVNSDKVAFCKFDADRFFLFAIERWLVGRNIEYDVIS